MTAQQEWLDWRRQGIGSSDAPVIMKVSPWRTPYQLWEEKTTGVSRVIETDSMRRGKALEEVARCWAEQELDAVLFSKNVQSSTNVWMRASLDAFDEDKKILIEIKWPSRADHSVAVGGKVPGKYYPQVQHQLMVCGLNEMFYLSCFEDDRVLVPISLDIPYSQELLEKESDFWEKVQKKIPPSLEEKDFISMEENLDWTFLAEKWHTLERKIKDCSCCKLKEELDQVEAALHELAGERNCKGSGLVYKKCQKKGPVDITKLNMSEEELDRLRKEPVVFWKIAPKKETAEPDVI